jgi:Domain of unknown function (DUF4112)
MLRRNVETAKGQEAVERIGRLVRVWDDAIRIPGLGWRVGLDPLVGLVPGAGDLVGFLVGLVPVLAAIRLGAGGSVVGRMLLNVVIDGVIGAIPIVGDIFDVVWRANRKNLALLTDWLARPDRVQRSSRALLTAIVMGAVVVTGGAIWLVVELVVAAVRAFT